VSTTRLLIALALVAAAFVAAAPGAAADNVVQCLQREGHPPEHCAPDCTPLGEPEDLFLPPDTNTPLNCYED
jgi:hypothetical protein